MPLLVQKLDAARRQLETAVCLHFSDGDPVSIHTLAWAAYTVVYDVNKKRGGSPTLVKDRFIATIKPEYRDEIKRGMNRARNFFKHAEKDPESELKFDPEQTDVVLFEACDLYRHLTGHIVPNFLVYIMWFVIHNKRFFNPPSPEIAVLVKRMQIKLSRREYYEMALPVVAASVEAIHLRRELDSS